MIFSLEKKNSDSIALCEDTGISMTYQQLCEEVMRFGERIQERSLVFCLCQNTAGALIGYLGCLNSNHVVMLLDEGIEKDMLNQLYKSYHPQYIFASINKTDLIEISPKELVYEVYGYGLFCTNTLSYPMYRELSLLLSTSGSIGNPKAVRISKKNIEANAASIKDYLELSDRERPITTLPMQYTYGLSVINSHLLAGACILMTKKSIVQKEFWDFLSMKEATSFAGVPFTYKMLKRMRILGENLPSVTSMTQAGGKLPEGLQREVAMWAKEQNIRFFIMYGQTEATARMSYLPHTLCLEKMGSIGIPIPGGVFRIKDESGNFIEKADTAGELIYEGKNVTLGYAQSMSDLNEGDEWHGILETGDIAKKDIEGFYYIIGRKKRFIKIYGVRIGLDECEQLLLNQYDGIEFACVGEDDGLRIYTNNAVVSESVCEWLSGKLHLNTRAFSSHLVKEIPKNDAGKILYSALK